MAQDYRIDPADGKSWGQGTYPPKGVHLCEITDVKPHMNYSNTDVVWDIHLDALDVGGSLVDKAGRAKAASCLLACGFEGGEGVAPDSLVGCEVVVEFSDSPGAGNSSKLYRSANRYFPSDHPVTPDEDIDWSPPPRTEESGSSRSARRSGKPSQEGDGGKGPRGRRARGRVNRPAPPR